MSNRASMGSRRDRNQNRADRGELLVPRGSSCLKVWRSNRTHTLVSVYTAADAGLDPASPWYASCDTHNTALGCDTKAAAVSAARESDTFCDGCRGEFA